MCAWKVSDNEMKRVTHLAWKEGNHFATMELSSVRSPGSGAEQVSCNIVERISLRVVGRCDLRG